MNRVAEMIRTHPDTFRGSESVLTQCIEACYECAQACESCADACLGEADVANLVRCIRFNLDCGAICHVTGQALSRQTEPDGGLHVKLLEACANACRVCGDECEKHASHHEHCRMCAEICRHCASACDREIEELRAATV